MKRSLIVLTLLCSLAFAFIIYSSAHSQSGFKSYTITLYSGGKSVGTWQSFQVVDRGSDFVSFYVGSQTFPKTVSISGTYSVEQTQ